MDDPKVPGEEPACADFQLGLLVLEKPLALIVGTVPGEPHGKANILKVPLEVLNLYESNSRIYRLAKYLTSLPQTTKGPLGGHRIPRGDEACVVGHLSLCASLTNTADGSLIHFSQEPLSPCCVLSETENGELSLKIEALTRDGNPVEGPVYFMGQSGSWVFAENVLYSIDLAAIHRLFPFFDAHGVMTVKLDVVPKFLAVDLPVLKRKMEVRVDESIAPFPIAIVEPPRVVIRASERANSNHETNCNSNSSTQPNLEVSLGFSYGKLVLPSRDETSAVESEQYTRTISDTGQSVWVKRLWEEEGQVRRFLTNLQPQRIIGDRFSFINDTALDTVYYLKEQCANWGINGLEGIQSYKVRNNPLVLKTRLSLKKDSFKFDFQLQACSDGDEIPFTQVVDALVRNRNYVKLVDGSHVRINAARLLSLLKAIGQGKETARPLYQALPIWHALKAHEVEIETDKGFGEFLDRIHNFSQLEPMQLHPEFSGELRHYQKDGCNWLSFLREYGLAGILADDMGLGKTIQTLALLLSHHKKKQRQPSLVVAPTSVVYNWMSEAEKFTPTLDTALFLGRDRGELLDMLERKNGSKPSVIFTTYGILRRDYETLKNIQFEYVILDEAQNIKNPESVGAIAAKSLTAFHRLALSGTPVENRLKELWSLFDFLMPEFLSGYKEFNENFERPIESGVDGAGQKLRKIVHPFILRRLKSQVETELPDRTDIVQICELDDEQRALYLEVLDECRQKVFSEIASRGIGRSQISVLAALLRLRQVCCDPRLLKNRENGQERSQAASTKLACLMEMMSEIIDEGHKILVFSQFVEMLTLIRGELEKAGYVYEYLDGQTPAQERLEKVNRFNADDKIPIFLISLKAGGTGLNLTGADYVIHYDPWWNPAVENQATDRAHRIGQTRHVFNYKLITRSTVEEKILALQRKKKELANLVIGGDEGVAKELTKEDLEFLFSF